MASSVASEQDAAAAAAAAADGPQPPQPPQDDGAILAEARRLVSALHAAVKSGDAAGVLRMIQASPIPHMLLNTRDPAQGGLAAVHVAARAGQERVLACLLEHGACAWLPDQEQGLSALDYARVRNRRGCLALLRRHIQAGPPPLKEVGPLVASFFEAPVEREWMAWALDHYGPAKLLDTRGRGHSSPLHFAMSNNDPQLIETLLELGADPFVKDAEGRSPLDVASLSGNPALVRAVSSAMRTQLLAFMGLAGLFLLYRNDGDAQQAWHVLALAYPATKTLHTLLVLVPALAADATRRANAMGEWLTYWGVISPLLLLEHLATTTPWGRRFTSALVAALTATTATAAPDSGAERPLPPAVRTLADVYMIAKIVGTLYLVYPASRGARRLYQGWIDREERAKRRARAERERAQVGQGQGQQQGGRPQAEGQGDKRKAD